MNEDKKLADDIVLKDTRQFSSEIVDSDQLGTQNQQIVQADPRASAPTRQIALTQQEQRNAATKNATQLAAITNKDLQTRHAPEPELTNAELESGCRWYAPLLLADTLLTGAGIVVLLSAVAMALFSLEHNILNAFTIWFSLLNLIWLGATGLFISNWMHGGILAHDGWLKLILGLSVYAVLAGNVIAAASKRDRTGTQRLSDIALVAISTFLLMPIPSIISLRKSIAASSPGAVPNKQKPDFKGWLIGGGAALALALPLALTFPTEEAWLEGYIVDTAIIMLLSIPIALFMRRNKA